MFSIVPNNSARRWKIIEHQILLTKHSSIFRLSIYIQQLTAHAIPVRNEDIYRFSSNQWPLYYQELDLILSYRVLGFAHALLLLGDRASIDKDMSYTLHGIKSSGDWRNQPEQKRMSSCWTWLRKKLMIDICFECSKLFAGRVHSCV